jgi:diguanylate cyclase (GGDEF)-like protein
MGRADPAEVPDVLSKRPLERADAAAMTPSLEPAACLATSWQVAPDLGLRLAVITGLAVLAGWSDAQRYFPGKRAFFWLNVVLALWIASTTAEHAAVDAACKTTIALLSWPAIALLPPLWTLFLHQHVSSETRPPRRRSVAWVALGIAALAAAALSNGLHGRFYGPGTTLGAPVLGLPRMRYEYGPLFFVTAAWGYAWLLAATAIVLQAVRQATPEDRVQWLTFLVMMLVPWASNVAYVAFGVRLFGGDPTPLSFAVAVVGFGWLIRSNNLFKVVPLSRRLLFVALPDPVLVLDTLSRVMDVNEAARRLAGREVARGQPLPHWPVFGRPLADWLDRQAAEPALLFLEQPSIVFEVRVSDIGEGDRRIGQLIQLRDVTAQHHAQARIAGTLAERDEQLRQVAQLEAELREQALRDPLTGLYNRRALAQRFEQERRHQQATGQALSLVLLDIDHFKRINDSFGHATGDAVLRAFATALRDAVRTSDAVFRIGGEEFALLLPNADALQATLRVQGLRQGVRALALPLVDGDVTFSAGVAACGAADSSLDALMRRADDALYRAKAGGRNQTMAAADGG